MCFPLSAREGHAQLTRLVVYAGAHKTRAARQVLETPVTPGLTAERSGLMNDCTHFPSSRGGGDHHPHGMGDVPRYAGSDS